MVDRRRFLQYSAAGPLLGGLARAATLAPVILPDGRAHRLSFGQQQFLLDGQPFQIRSGEMHPIRIPVGHWRHRIRMAKAMGLNTIALYVMWNALESEPGMFDFSGRRDFARFIRLCQQEGMWVYLRPGPYVCAEWDFGGLPAYLLRQPGLQVRSGRDPYYRAAMLRYLDAIAPRIRPLLASAGGPILMVQVENEYASYGHDLDYLAWLRDEWIARGIPGPFSLSDGLAAIQKQQTYLPGTALGLDGDTDFAAAQVLAGQAPVWVGEGYPGWLTHWGDQRMQSADYSPTLAKLLQQGRSFNLYVVHGGSNFGLGAGANAQADGSGFQPVLTSYDYGAPIREDGAASAQYHQLRALLGQQLGRPLPPVPAQPPMAGFARIEAQPWASLWDSAGPGRSVVAAAANEYLLGQNQGLVLYRKPLPAAAGRQLQLREVHDYATVHYAGQPLGVASRVAGPGLVAEPQWPLPDEAGLLEILVDSFGHVGYGQDMHDRKGLLRSPQLNGQALDGWTLHGLPLDRAWLRQLQPARSTPRRPGIVFRASLSLPRPTDTYLDMSEWSKGYVWVNGELLGRYWQLGPQQRLYCPADFLRAGANEILVLDLHRTVATGIRGLTTLQG